jgi:hypothetical protein
MNHRFAILLVVTMAAGVPATSRAENFGTLALDGLSFVSFDGEQNLPIPAGSSIRFRFGDIASGQASFTIDPADVVIAPIPLGEDGAVLHYRLRASATGTVRKIDGTPKLEFAAEIEAATTNGSGSAANSYSLLFTTETATATSLDQSEQIEVDGMRVIPGPNYVQLVGGATNKPDAFPQPGSAVYCVLSGSFDWFPNLP